MSDLFGMNDDDSDTRPAFLSKVAHRTVVKVNKWEPGRLCSLVTLAMHGGGNATTGDGRVRRSSSIHLHGRAIRGTLPAKPTFIVWMVAEASDRLRTDGWWTARRRVVDAGGKGGFENNASPNSQVLLKY
ncbi:hypothetical protein E2562_014273 [Oryza meyeriana var. granulata]|uniref:Uncharacterized protein n=1 Tax=Oryza meyeriana var. granulata TaxID=110450 RepID=A0A6G1C781_9ORYZ|nr:hypothetical protein E2562_014273 [Oryza meyeriana var. granulata]